jgi:hypothetical protein
MNRFYKLGDGYDGVVLMRGDVRILPFIDRTVQQWKSANDALAPKGN